MSNPVNFSLADFLFSETAYAQGIDNTPTWEVVDNLKRLAEVMERIRSGAGDLPVTILSGYRCPTLNQAIGGAENSAHLWGMACDFVIPAWGTPLEVCQALEPHLGFLEIDQLIWEFGDWVHLGMTGGVPRGQCLTIDENGTCEGF